MATDKKYIKLAFNIRTQDLKRRPNATNWASLNRHLLLSLGFNKVWLQQWVGNYIMFVSLLKQRHTDTVIQNWKARLETSSRAVFYKSVAVFKIQPYLENVNVKNVNLYVVNERLNIV